MQVTIDFPIIADPTREISVKYGMLDPGNVDLEGLPLTCRAVFIIGVLPFRMAWSNLEIVRINRP